MILTAHQPVYLPWLGLFHKIALSDVFCFFDCVQYQPKDWNNRNKIKFSNGKASWLTVPVLRKGYLEKSYLDIRINNDIPWRKKHWSSIATNYAKAPFFHTYKDEIRKLYEREWDFLVDLNYEMLLCFLKLLGISVKMIRMRDYSFKGQKSELVLDMCLTLNADIYIFGAEGRNYADVEAFQEAGVIPYFQEYTYPAYPQLHGDFISHLSVLDLLLNCGEESLKVLLSGNITRLELESLKENGRACPERKYG